MYDHMEVLIKMRNIYRRYIAYWSEQCVGNYNSVYYTN